MVEKGPLPVRSAIDSLQRKGAADPPPPLDRSPPSLEVDDTAISCVIPFPFIHGMGLCSDEKRYDTFMCFSFFGGVNF